MYEWQKQIQNIVDEIDICIQHEQDADLTLKQLSKKLGYSPFYTTRKFKEITGMQLRDYLHKRKLAYALKEIRDSERSILDIAIMYGFSSHEAFTRAFKKMYGTTPSKYRKEPKPLILRTKIHPFDRYCFGLDEIGKLKTNHDIKTYYVSIPAHKFLYIKNTESNGYWDFWEKQSHIPMQDYETICGLLDSIKGKLDDYGGHDADSGNGQIMAYISDLDGRLCDWGFLRSECYGVRLPISYQGEIPPQMHVIDIPEADYLVFEHGPFHYEQENRSVEAVMETAMKEFNFANTGYAYDTTPGRILYFYFYPNRYWKYIRPIRKI